MDSQTCLTILGGLISGLVGVGLFFLQRFKAGRDEQRRLLFQIYQLIVIPARAAAGEDPGAIAAHQNIADAARTEEISTLAVRLKDVKLAAEVLRSSWMAEEDRYKLAVKIRARVHPKLVKFLKEQSARQSAGTFVMPRPKEREEKDPPK